MEKIQVHNTHQDINIVWKRYLIRYEFWYMVFKRDKNYIALH